MTLKRGIKASGFPGGSAGVYQTVEAVTQLRGHAGANQIAGAKVELILTQSLGEPAFTAASHILQKMDYTSL